MNRLRKGLPELPVRMRNLRINEKGYPIPYFVRNINGVYDFRIMDEVKLVNCFTHSLCWICGSNLGIYRTFVVGPMCVVNRTSAEPPSHSDCAMFAAKACPFLAHPKAVRREAGMPEVLNPAGVMLEHNPGVTALYTTRRYRIRYDKGILFEVGEPDHVRWFREGRPATRHEILEGMDLGIPKLREMCGEDQDQHDLLDVYITRARQYIPAT